MTSAAARWVRLCRRPVEPDLLQLTELFIEGGGGAGAAMEGVEVEFLVGGMNAVVGEAEAYEQSVNSKLAFEEADDGDGPALPHARWVGAEADPPRLGGAGDGLAVGV